MEDGINSLNTKIDNYLIMKQNFH